MDESGMWAPCVLLADRDQQLQVTQGEPQQDTAPQWGFARPGQESCVLRYRPLALTRVAGLMDTGLHPCLGTRYSSPAGANHSSGR